MLALQTPSAGEILIDNISLHRYAQSELLDRFAIALQDPETLNATVRHNITLGREINDGILREAVTVACFDEVLSQLPLGEHTMLSEKGSSLSGGQRQRLSIARAIVKRPSLLILDEATSQLETQLEAKIIKNIRDYLPNTLIVLIAHHERVLEHADEVVTLPRS